MNLTNTLSRIALCSALLIAGTSVVSAQTPHTFAVTGDHFTLDGKPFQIISGEMHYPRIPRAYWRQRLKLAKAMGLNTITTYVFWNVHEPTPGNYDFTGQNDVAEFVREAQQEGLYVLLRPGPYSCAEWEFGGYPAWLLKDHDIIVRSSDPKFIGPATTWLHRLGKELAPLQIGNGGPIIAVQVENEYGSFGDDHAYMEQIHHALLDSGFNKAMLYTADGPEQLPKGSLPELPAVINFGTGEARESFATLHTLRPNGPFMSGEYWAGWFDHWGEKHQSTDAAKQADDIAWMLSQGYSMSLYMIHGGTSFGWMNGANFSHGEYQPDVNSYDYDAAIDESGRPRAKYFTFRDIIAKATNTTLPPVPEIPPAQTIPAFSLTQTASLWDNLPKPVQSHDLKTMEDLDQAYGYILYRTTAPADAAGDLVLDGLHDYAQIYIDGRLAGMIDRRLKQTTLHITVKKGARIDLLVENTGRINFSRELRGERKGIVGSAKLAGTALTDWQIFSLPLTNTAQFQYTNKPCEGVCLYRGTFNTSAQQDTFVDTSAFTKGFVWVNGHPLGRIWNVGPQRTLYLPGPWLHTGSNDITVLDLQGKTGATVTGLDQPILDAPALPKPVGK